MTRRLVVAMTALAAAVALALAIPLAVIVDNDQRAAFVAGLEVDTLATATTLAAQDPVAWEDTALDVAARTGARVVVVDDGAALVADSDRSALDRSFDRAEIRSALLGELASDVRYSATLGTDLRFVAAPVVQDGRVVAAVRLSLPETDVDALVASTRMSLAAFVVAVVVTAALVAWLIAYSIATPLRRVAEAAEALSADLATRAPEDAGPPEVRSVARALNGTAERLGAILRRQERVAADASHHLRTPLTGVRLRLEAIEDLTDSAGIRAEATAAMAEVDRLGRRIEQVLALARSDAGESAVVVEAGDVVVDRCAASLATAQAAGIELEADVPDDAVPVLAARGALERVVDELIGNALTYAESRVVVAVRPAPDGASVEVSVGDDGPGLPADEMTSVFERFARGSAAAPGGSGLGLALVREIARASGGEAEAGRSVWGGLQVRTTWPSADRP